MIYILIFVASIAGLFLVVKLSMLALETPERPYEIGERDIKLDELDEERRLAIEGAKSPAMLDYIEAGYQKRLAEIEKHK